jgi:ligand-binding sensor domain-containing protein
MWKQFLYAVLISIIGIFMNERLISQTKNATKSYYNFQRLDEQKGLTNNVINDILQDSIGFIWIATNDGLFRYDGTEFITFRNQPGDSNSIPHNAVQALHLDEKNNVWALTDYGIGIYNQNQRK